MKRAKQDQRTINQRLEVTRLLCRLNSETFQQTIARQAEVEAIAQQINQAAAAGLSQLAAEYEAEYGVE